MTRRVINLSPDAGRAWVAAAVAAVSLAAPPAAEAQSALRLLPMLRADYQARIETISAGDIPQVFLGTASVAPDRGFPWMVSLQIKGAQSAIGHFCGGIAIDPSWVLTAAHCVAGATQPEAKAEIELVDPAKIQILVRSNVLSLGGEIKPASRIVLHPQFRITPDHVPENDLALVQIGERPNLKPLKLATEARANGFLKVGSLLRIFGWGTASFSTKGAVSNNLLYAFVDVVDRARCNEPAVYDGSVDSSMFCAGIGAGDACQGDSGGPAVGYVSGGPVLVGVTSWGVGCSEKKFPGVYVNVAKFSGWIGETLASK